MNQRGILMKGVCLIHLHTDARRILMSVEEAKVNKSQAINEPFQTKLRIHSYQHLTTSNIVLVM